MFNRENRKFQYIYDLEFSVSYVMMQISNFSKLIIQKPFGFEQPIY